MLLPCTTSILLFAITALISEIAAFPTKSSNPSSAEILKYQSESDGYGRYKFLYETSNDIQRAEIGKISNPESDDPILVVKGFYSYIDDDGTRHEVHYVADEKGYQPKICFSQFPLTFDQPKTGVTNRPKIIPTSQPKAALKISQPQVNVDQSETNKLEENLSQSEEENGQPETILNQPSGSTSTIKLSQESLNQSEESKEESEETPMQKDTEISTTSQASVSEPEVDLAQPEVNLDPKRIETTTEDEDVAAEGPAKIPAAGGELDSDESDSFNSKDLVNNK